MVQLFVYVARRCGGGRRGGQGGGSRGGRVFVAGPRAVLWSEAGLFFDGGDPLMAASSVMGGGALLEN